MVEILQCVFDPIGRALYFPPEKCNTYEDLHLNIVEAFQMIPTLEEEVANRHYNIFKAVDGSANDHNHYGNLVNAGNYEDEVLEQKVNLVMKMMPTDKFGGNLEPISINGLQPQFQSDHHGTVNAMFGRTKNCLVEGNSRR